MTTAEILDRMARQADPSGLLCAWLSMSGFYMDPASTKYHRAYPGGLADHVLGMLLWLVRLANAQGLHGSWSLDTLALVALAHDLCKVGRYEVVRVRRDPAGDVTEYGYRRGATLVLGHGDQSLFLLVSILQTTDIDPEVLMAIRHHMGVWGAAEGEERSRLAEAMQRSPLVILAQAADELDTKHGLSREVLPEVAETELRALGACLGLG